MERPFAAEADDPPPSDDIRIGWQIREMIA
jgi:hypothetical protein